MVSQVWLLLAAAVLPLLLRFLYSLWRVRLELRRWFFDGIGPTMPHHTACVIWLHGTGDHGAGFKWLRDVVSRNVVHVKLALPTAAFRPFTAMQGKQVRAWMDVESFPITPEDLHHAASLEEAIARVHRLLDGEVAAGVPAERIVLAGFSQGAAVALWAAHRYPSRLAGVVLWSGFAASPEELGRALGRSASGAAPHLCCHGGADDRILPACGKQVVELLRRAKVPVQEHVYKDVAHGCCGEQITELVEFLNKHVPKQSGEGHRKKASKERKAGKDSKEPKKAR